jgi:hypothetical protein
LTKKDKKKSRNLKSPICRRGINICGSVDFLNIGTNLGNPTPRDIAICEVTMEQFDKLAPLSIENSFSGGT